MRCFLLKKMDSLTKATSRQYYVVSVTAIIKSKAKLEKSGGTLTA